MAHLLLAARPEKLRACGLSDEEGTHLRKTLASLFDIPADTTPPQASAAGAGAERLTALLGELVKTPPTDAVYI